MVKDGERLTAHTIIGGHSTPDSSIIIKRGIIVNTDTSNNGHGDDTCHGIDIALPQHFEAAHSVVYLFHRPTHAIVDCCVLLKSVRSLHIVFFTSSLLRHVLYTCLPPSGYGSSITFSHPFVLGLLVSYLLLRMGRFGI